jgi:hypothetical protein
VRANYLSSCGNGLVRSVKLTNQALSTLPAPSSLTGAVNICPIAGTSTSTRYVASAVTGAVSYNWIIPQGAVIDSGNNGLKIRVRFISPGSNDSIAVQAIGSNGCFGAKRVLYLQTAECIFMKTIVGSGKSSIIEDEFNVNVFPNPTSSSFYLKIVAEKSNSAYKFRLFDLQGRRIREMSFYPNTINVFGDDLTSGIYFLEVMLGDKSKTIKLLKY